MKHRIQQNMHAREKTKKPLRFILPGILLLFCAITTVIYSNTFDTPFLFDDRPFILDDPAVRMTELTWNAVNTAAFESIPKHRYLVNISFALNYYLGHYHPAGYHITNIIIHLLTGMLLFFFIRTTLTRFHVPPNSGMTATPLSSMLVAFFATLLWLVFPVNTGAVTYVVQRMTSLAALFYVLSIWLYVIGRISHQNSSHICKPVIYFAGCFFAGCCAVMTKENTATLPFVILLYEWFFFQDLRIDFLKRKGFYAIGAVVVFGAIAYHYLGSNPLEWILKSYDYNDRAFNLPQRVMTEWRVIIHYISLFLWPSPGRLNLDYDFPLSSGLNDPTTTVLSLMALAAVTAIAVFIARRHRLIAFCLFWCLINLVIESSVIGLEIIYEHRMYLPFMTIFLMFVLLVFQSAAAPRVPIAFLSILVLLFSAWTWQRNTTWANPVGFSLDNVKKSPQKARPHLNLGNYYAENGNHDQAIGYFKAALTLDPGRLIRVRIYNSLANSLVQSGRLGEAPLYYFKALAMYPKYKTAQANLQQIKNIIDSLSGPKNTLMKEQTAAVYNRAGTRLQNEGKLDEALIQIQTALVFQPDDATLYYSLACLYALQKQKDAAVYWLKQAIDQGYDNWEKIKTDDDLKNIRKLPEVESMIATHAASTD